MDRLELELTFTIRPWDLIGLDEEQKRLIENNRNMFFSPVDFPTDFAFNCKGCEEAAPHLNPYRILKQPKPEVATVEGIFPVDSLDEKPEFTSHLNYVLKLGYVCDPCKDSILS